MQAKAFFYLIIPMLLALSYQNCSRSEHISSEELSSYSEAQEFFGYGYDTKPVFLTDLVLLKPKTQIAKLTQFKVVATATYVPNIDSQILYRITVTTPQGVVMCPEQTGTLLARQSYIEFDCASAVIVTNARVRLTVSAQGKSAVLNRLYIE